jgi:hypothetical protein
MSLSALSEIPPHLTNFRPGSCSSSRGKNRWRHPVTIQLEIAEDAEMDEGFGHSKVEVGEKTRNMSRSAWRQQRFMLARMFDIPFLLQRGGRQAS